MGWELRPDGTVVGFKDLEELLDVRRRIIEQDRALGQSASSLQDKAHQSETPALSEDQRKAGLAMLRALAAKGGEMTASELTEELGLKDAKAIGRYAIPARSVLREKLSDRQVARVLSKRRERDRGSIWILDVQKAKEAGIVLT